MSHSGWECSMVVGQHQRSSLHRSWKWGGAIGAWIHSPAQVDPQTLNLKPLNSSFMPLDIVAQVDPARSPAPTARGNVALTAGQVPGKVVLVTSSRSWVVFLRVDLGGLVGPGRPVRANFGQGGKTTKKKPSRHLSGVGQSLSRAFSGPVRTALPGPPPTLSRASARRPLCIGLFSGHSRSSTPPSPSQKPRRNLPKDLSNARCRGLDVPKASHKFPFQLYSSATEGC